MRSVAASKTDITENIPIIGLIIKDTKMLFEFKDNGNNNIVLPIEPLLSKLNGATETEIKVLIYAAAAAQDGVFDEKTVQELSGMDLTEILIALQYWRGSEVITIS